MSKRWNINKEKDNMVIKTVVLHATAEGLLYMVSALTAPFLFKNVCISLEIYQMFIWDFQGCRPEYILPKYDWMLQYMSLKIIAAVHTETINK